MSNLTLRDAIKRFVPRWMRTGEGYKYLYSFALLGDYCIQFAVEGARAKMPTLASSDALPQIGRDRRIRRGFAESDDTYRPRLLTWRVTWRKAGGAYNLLRQLKAYWTGYAGDMRVVNANGTWWTLNADDTVERVVTLPAKNWDWDGDASLYGRAWAIFYASALGISHDGTWGDGETWGDNGTTWGSTATPEQVQTVRTIIRSPGKSGACVYKNVIVSFDDAAFDPADAPGTSGEPDGTWGGWSTVVAGFPVAARNPDAIYWDGVLD